MINVTGEVFVTNLKELSPRLIGGTVYSFEKIKDSEEFKATFIKAKFVGDALTYIIQNNIMDKTKVNILSGVMKSNEWTDKSGKEYKTLEITCFKLGPVEKKEDHSSKENKSNSRFKNNNNSNNRFKNTTAKDYGELPF